MTITLRDDAVREYGTAKGWRIFLYGAGPALIALFLYGAFAIWSNKADSSLALSIGLSALMVGFAGFFAYSLVVVAKWRVVVTADRIIEQNIFPFRSKEIRFEDVAGFHINEQITVVVAQAPSKTTVKFGYTTESYGQLQQWLADRFPDLDVESQQAEEREILGDPTLGFNEEQRARQLEAARQTARVLTIAGGATAAWLWWQPQPYQWAITAGLLVPLAAMGALWLHPGLLNIDEKKGSAYPSIGIALLLPSLLLALRALLDTELVSYGPLWRWVGAATVFFAALLALGTRSFLQRPGSRLSQAFAIALCAFAYSFGAVSTYNSTFDEAPAAAYPVKVLDKHTSSGNTTTYYLKVSPWGPFRQPEDVAVTKNYYAQSSIGATATMLLRPGRLGIPWYTVAE
ncbi:hypothetical protein [Hymenobacter sp. B81]|uniref:hypothetical protein n=1 Tax=Hymenobacter sp. B81 TaxID=3344878 RepID=UPI0037DDD827